MSDGVFEITHKCGKARTGILTTEHGKVQTPFFMPVASKASVKAVAASDIEKLGYESLISNSFILSMFPGIDIIHDIGGIHKFMNYKKCIFTDSGGFQVLSKTFLQKKNDESVLFKDLKGDRHTYTPKICMENQIKLGSDVAMTLDDVTHYGMDGKSFVDAIRRTHNWARTCLKEHKKLKKDYGSNQLIFGICQGGTSTEYRRFSSVKINKMGFDGLALGGMVIGESRKELLNTAGLTVEHFDEGKIKYLMGLGSPSDIVQAIGMGIDCFDSIYPTSNARHGSIITSKGRIRIRRREYANDFGPIEEGCKCECCKNYSKAYLHHLIKTGELLGFTLATKHNLYFMNKLIRDCRKAIIKGNYDDFVKQFLADYFSGSEKREFGSNIQDRYMEELKPKNSGKLLEYHG